MAYSIKPSRDRRLITLKVSGDITADVMLKYIVEAHALGKELGVHRYLVDALEARNVDSTVKNYEFAYSEFKEMPGIDQSAIVAAVVSPEDHSHDFVATTLNNAGHPLELFHAQDEAIDYLMSRP